MFTYDRKKKPSIVPTATPTSTFKRKDLLTSSWGTSDPYSLLPDYQYTRPEVNE